MDPTGYDSHRGESNEFLSLSLMNSAMENNQNFNPNLHHQNQHQLHSNSERNHHGRSRSAAIQSQSIPNGSLSDYIELARTVNVDLPEEIAKFSFSFRT